MRWTPFVALAATLLLAGACGEKAATDELDAGAISDAAPNEDAARGQTEDVQTGDVLADSGAPNATHAGLVLNEVVTSAEGDGTDWIELFAAGTEAVDLAQFTLVDDSPDHEPATLPEVTLQPGEYFILLAVDADDEVFAPSVPFKLGSDDGVWLALDGEVVDVLDWDEAAAPKGSSWGRLPDGATTVARLNPTPGEANVAWDGVEPEPDPKDCDLFPQDAVLSIQVEMAESAWQAILADPEAEEYQEATLTIDGLVAEQMAFRTKGNSSLHSVANNPNSQRYSWKVDTNRYVDGQKLCGLKKFNLNNGFKDPTLIREHIGYGVSREMGLPTPRTAFADVTVNGVHLGLYTLVEHVDSEFIERWFDDDTGDLYKPDWPDGTLQWKGADFADYDGIDLESNEDTTDHSAFMTLLEALNQGDDDAVAAVVDVDAMLRYLALNTLLVNLDSYSGNGHNYYLYEQSGVFTPVPWDLNEAFGNFNCGCDREGIIGLLIDDPTCGAMAGKPLVERVLGVDSYREQYHAYLAEFIAADGPFGDAAMVEKIHAAADLIRPFVEADTEKFSSTAQFETNLTEDIGGGGGGGGGTTIGLTTFVIERIAAITAQLAGSAESSAGGDGSCGGGMPGGNGPPDGGPPDGQNPKCPDGICDGFEQANPNACPEDCD